MKTTFEQSKWLKTKQFNEYTKIGYSTTGEYYYHQGGQEEIRNDEDYYEGRDYKGGDFLCSAPEQHQVVEWLRVNHGIWIYVKRGCEIINNEAFDKFQPIIEFIPQIKFDIVDLSTFASPREAYSAAFDYIKDNNLI